MTTTHPKVSTLPPPRKTYTPLAAAIDLEAVFSLLEGRWKLLILFHLFGGQVQRWNDIYSADPERWSPLRDAPLPSRRSA